MSLCVWIKQNLHSFKWKERAYFWKLWERPGKSFQNSENLTIPLICKVQYGTFLNGPGLRDSHNRANQKRSGRNRWKAKLYGPVCCCCLQHSSAPAAAEKRRKRTPSGWSRRWHSHTRIFSSIPLKQTKKYKNTTQRQGKNLCRVK